MTTQLLVLMFPTDSITYSNVTKNVNTFVTFNLPPFTIYYHEHMLTCTIYMNLGSVVNVPKIPSYIIRTSYLLFIQYINRDAIDDNLPLSV